MQVDFGSRVPADPLSVSHRVFALTCQTPA